MLFNSYVFIFVFLPVVAVFFFLIARISRNTAAMFLAIVSFFFYGWWSPQYVLLLFASILVNFLLARAIATAPVKPKWSRRRWILFIAISLNLALLAYYKYSNFFFSTVSYLSGSTNEFIEVVMPLGISFFTFTQIAFLVDTYQGKSSEPNFIHYCLFVTYFPHLIAGPILHHSQMMPQFQHAETYKFSSANVSIGLAIFVIGLFKKVVIADSLAPHSNTVFSLAASGQALTFFDAWSGALAYTLQLYFDFSGYSDMAIGISRMFNVTLPLNFNSPYKATSIIEFWRHWHMTLSNFLRDYLYIPLGGGRKGTIHRYMNLMITMLLGGLWHGAGWTFVLWGGVHGLYLVINHAWRTCVAYCGLENSQSTVRTRIAGRTITFLAVVFAWILFRAESLDAAVVMFRGMLGLTGVVLQAEWQSKLFLFADVFNYLGINFGSVTSPESVRALVWMLPILVFCWLAPNTQEIMAGFRPALDFSEGRAPSFIRWKPNLSWAFGIAILAVLSVLLITRKSEFLYFQF